jgi:glycerol-3-phosphate acyltransferase PlsX
VGLLSIGEEPGKGDALTLAAHELLAAAPVNFIGNVEGDQLFSEGVDVVVADGFVGNVALKVTEGVAHFMSSYLMQSIRSTWWRRLAALLLKQVFHGLRSKMDYAAHGGALLLGVQGICVVCHGRSNALAIENALLVAQRAIQGQVREHLTEGIARLAEIVPPSLDSAADGSVGK